MDEMTALESAAESALSEDEMQRSIRRLWAAVLHQAIMDYCDFFEHESARPAGRVYDRKYEIVRWLENTDHAVPGSFGWICDLLDLDADRLRGRITREWPQLAQAARIHFRRDRPRHRIRIEIEDNEECHEGY